MKYAATYGDSHALVIGIDAYQHAPGLQFAVNDARAVAQSLVDSCGFPLANIAILANAEATRSAITKALMGFRARLGVDDRLVVFFAGHGHTETGRRGEVGFLVPVDGRVDDLSTLIRWQELTQAAEVIQAKHTLFVMDACYSGLATTRDSGGAGRARFMADLLTRPAVQVLAAGKADQPVADGGGVRPGHSLFTAHLLDALEGAASPDGHVLTASQVMAYVVQKVGADDRSRQTPQWAVVEGDGDLVFRPMGDQLLAPASGKLDLTGRFEAPAAEIAPTVAEEIAQRFRRFLHLINVERNGNDRFTLPQIAEILGHTDWRRLEALAAGQGDLGLAELKTLAAGLGLNADWLIHGKAAPFDNDPLQGDADAQYEDIRTLRPQRVVAFREAEKHFDASIAVQLDDLRWRVFGHHHPVTPEVGGTGKRQLLAFCQLLRRLFRLYWKQAGRMTGQQVSSAEFEDLLAGDAYPGSILNRLRDDPWWQDFAELAGARVRGQNAAADALRGAIRVTRSVLAEELDRAETIDWRRERLTEAGFPLKLTEDYDYLDMDPPDGGPAPGPETETSWPRVAALDLIAARFTFSAAHDHVLLDGRCEIDLHNRAKVPLDECRVFLDSLEQAGATEQIGSYLLDGQQRGATSAGARLPPDAMKRLTLCKRDLKDIISRPPWLLALEKGDHPLFDGRRYVLNLELRSSYEHPTRVKLALQIAVGKEVAAEILEQTV